MAKRIQIGEVRAFTGQQLNVPVIDSEGNAEQSDNGQVKMRSATTLDLAELLVRSYPRKHLNMTAIVECNQLWSAVTKARENGKAVLELPDSTHKWVMAQLEAEEIGVSIFAMNLLQVQQAFKNVASKDSLKAVK